MYTDMRDVHDRYQVEWDILKIRDSEKHNHHRRVAGRVITRIRFISRQCSTDPSLALAILVVYDVKAPENHFESFLMTS